MRNRLLNWRSAVAASILLTITGAVAYNRYSAPDQQTAPLEHKETETELWDNAEELEPGTVLLDTKSGQRHSRPVRFYQSHPEGPREAIVSFHLGPDEDSGPLVELSHGIYRFEDRDPIFQKRYSLHVGTIAIEPNGIVITSHTPQFKDQHVRVSTAEILELHQAAPGGTCQLNCTLPNHTCTITMQMSCIRVKHTGTQVAAK